MQKAHMAKSWCKKQVPEQSGCFSNVAKQQMYEIFSKTLDSPGKKTLHFGIWLDITPLRAF